MPSIFRDLAQDLRLSVRALRAKPGFTLVAVFTLALAIGANTALFSVVNGVLLRPLPYDDPDRLVQLWESHPSVSDREGSSTGGVKEWRVRSRSFEGIAGWYVMGRTLKADQETVVVRTAQVSADFFPVMGTSPLMGRTFTMEETQRSVFSRAAAPVGEDPVVVLSHRIWRSRFHADPDIVGRRISIERRTWTVVGVMPPEFAMPDAGVELWIPWSFQGDRARDQRYLQAVARLKPGVDLVEAQRDMDLVAAAMSAEFPATHDGWGVRVTPLLEEQVGHARKPLLVLLGAVAVVLVVACVNVASLQLARATERGPEMAVRTALGASRPRVIRQLLTESLLLSAAGGGLGTILAAWSVDWIRALRPGDLPRLQSVSLDLRVLGFTFLTVAITGLLFGLAPALVGSRVDLAAAMKEDGGRSSGSPRRQRLRALLVVSEVALAMLLLAGAGLLLRSFDRLRAVDPGFEPSGVLVAPIFLNAEAYGSSGASRAYYRQLMEDLSALPGVESVGAATALPASPLGPDFDRPVWPEGGAPAPGGASRADIRMATTGYFRTMGMRIIRGRAFTAADHPEARRTVIVNETLARRLWPGGDPVGRNLVIDYSTAGTYPYEIVGVVNDIRFYGLRSEPRPEAYLPHAQRPYLVMNVAVRTDGDARALVPEVRQVIRRLDPDQPAHSVLALPDLLGDTIARDRLATLLLSSFAGAALLLALLGIFGILAYHVSQRGFEISIRMALGAGPASIFGWVVSHGMGLALAGVAAGTLLALALTRLLGGLLFGVGPQDPATFLAVAGLISLAAFLASYLPARRAARVDLARSLRRN